MDIQELIFMILSLVALIYFSTTGAPKRTEEEDEEDEEEERPHPVKKKASSQKMPPPAPAVKSSKHKTPLRATSGADEKFIFRSSMEEFEQRSAVEERKLVTHLRPGEQLVSEDLREKEGMVYKKQKVTPIQQILRAMPKKNSIVVAREVLDIPVAFRKSIFPRDV